MGDASKPPTRISPIVAAIISVVVAGMLGLAAGSKVDDLVRPTLGPTGAIVAGFGSAFAVLVGLGVVCYRGLTR
jgi:hypothetical protein